MRCWLALCLLLVLVACEPEATPFPIEIPPTETAIPPPSTPEPIRYALANNTLGLIPDLDLIRASAQVEQLTQEVNSAELGTRFDLVAAYGQIPGWTQTDITPTASLIVNLPDDSELERILRNSINPQVIIDGLGIEEATPSDVVISPPETLRTELANLGRPDGFSVSIGHTSVPGAPGIVEQLRGINVDSRLLALTSEGLRDSLSSGEIQLAVMMWTQTTLRDEWTAEFGAENVIDLYTIPVSYLAVPELTISFTPGGFPLPERQP